MGADRFEKAKKGDKADATVVREKDVITGHISRYMDTIDHKTAFKIDDTIDANRKKSKSKSGFQKKVGLIFVTLGVIIVINFFIWAVWKLQWNLSEMLNVRLTRNARTVEFP